MYKKYRDLASARTFLETDQHGVPTPIRLKVCVALLLYKMAAADGAVDRSEYEEMIRELNSEFHETDEASAEFLDAAALLAREETHFDQFIGEVNRVFDVAQREHLFDMLLKVATADGSVDQCEREFASILKQKLNLIP